MRRSNPFKRRLLSALLCSAPLLARADAAQTEQLLSRFAHSMGELNYRGVMSYSRDNHLESLRITHGTLNGEEFERLEHLDGQHREVIRHGQQLTCIQLGQRFSLLFHQRLLKEGLAGLNAFYDIQAGGEDRVAGRRAVALIIKPRDGFRYGYRLALDYDTGLLLRSESLDAAGKVLERLQFVEVEIGQPLKKEWLGDVPAAASVNVGEQGGIQRVVEEVQMPWRPQWLPAGFVLSVAPHRTSEDVLTYSDGLAVLSVFVEAAKGPLPSNGGTAVQGATVAYSRATQFGPNPYVVTVVGEVPTDTAGRVAESVVWDGGS
ncbi:MAG: hypothetical protein JWM78_1186 [Verrucomicrobiaceae bacterium]|nr:hypothetical protein [Verrucomicrobiaceae bacterium]